MIFLSDPQTSELHSFNNHAELCRYFNRQEEIKTVLGKSKDTWKFVFLPWRHLNILEQHLPCEQLSQVEQQAFHHQLDVVEVYQGGEPVQVPLRGDVDILSLRKDWCQAYAAKADLMIFESNLPKL